MSYVVIKTIKKRQYRYLQTSYREGKKVRTKSVYLGPASGYGMSGGIPDHGRANCNGRGAATGFHVGIFRASSAGSAPCADDALSDHLLWS